MKFGKLSNKIKPQNRNVTVSSAFIRKNFLQDPSEDFDNLEIIEGNKLELECMAPKGHPIPVIRWERDNQPLIESDRIKVTQMGLKIRSLQEIDAGSYTCIAENIAGSISSN